MERYKQRYPDFGPTLAAEKLNLDGYKRIDHETLRQWLVKEGAVAQETKEVWTQDMATEEGTFWRIGTNGWVNSPVV